jgi:hypothetical protein
MVDIALWYDARGAGGSVPVLARAVRSGAAKCEPSAVLAAQRRPTRGGATCSWGECRSARRDAQAAFA